MIVVFHAGLQRGAAAQDGTVALGLDGVSLGVIVPADGQVAFIAKARRVSDLHIVRIQARHGLLLRPAEYDAAAADPGKGIPDGQVPVHRKGGVRAVHGNEAGWVAAPHRHVSQDLQFPAEIYFGIRAGAPAVSDPEVSHQYRACAGGYGQPVVVAAHPKLAAVDPAVRQQNAVVPVHTDRPVIVLRAGGEHAVFIHPGPIPLGFKGGSVRIEGTVQILVALIADPGRIGHLHAVCRQIFYGLLLHPVEHHRACGRMIAAGGRAAERKVAPDIQRSLRRVVGKQGLHGLRRHAARDLQRPVVGYAASPG